MNRSFARLLLGIVVILIVAAGVAGVGWWKISQLKNNLVHDLETSLGARVEIASLNFDPWHREIRATGVSLVNQRPDAPWEKGEIGQATVRFRLRKLFAPTLPINVEVSSWNVVLSPHRATTPESPTPTEAALASSPSSSNRIHVMHLNAREGDVEIHLNDEKKILIHNVAFEASDNGAEVWTTHLKTESILAGTLKADSSSVDLRGDRDKITFSKFRMQVASGIVTGEGEISLHDNHAKRLNLKAIDVPIAMLVGTQWQLELAGLTSGDLAYDGNDETGAARGHLTLTGAKLNLFPWLGKVTAFVGLPDITNVEVDKATTDFEWKDGTVHLTNLDVRKNEVSRLSGTVDINPQSQVDGSLKLGMPSATLAKWPQLQQKVFSTQLDDYSWADVHVTGTPGHLQEDLTPRLVAAGATEGGGVLNQATQKAYDLLKGVLNN